MIQDIKKQIIQEYPYKTELHSHSLPVSSCAEFRAEALVKEYKKTGVCAMVLTNHFTPKHIERKTKELFVDEYIEAFREFSRCAAAEGIVAIFGMELRFAENINDYLLYGIDEADAYRIADYVDMGLARFREEFQKEGYLLLQAHPKRNGMTDMPLELLDGYEVFNMHPGHNSRPAISAREIKGEGKVVSGGSDFHNQGFEGCCLLRTRYVPKNSREVADILRSGDYVLEVGESIILP